MRYDATLTVVPRYYGELEMDLQLTNDNLVVIDGLKEQILGGANLNNATSTMVLTTLAGTTVSGTTFPITLTYATNSAGRYEGILPAGLSLTEGTEYLLKVTVTSGGATVAYWQKRVIAVNRRN